MKKKRNTPLSACFFIGLFLLVMCTPSGWAAGENVLISKEGTVCIGCHEALSPSFVQEWRISKHALKEVDCYTCHKAEKSDPDAMEHNGFIIAVLVTPKDCGRCHDTEVNEMTTSHHA